jgi:DNA-binding transcriptional MerR regulator
MTARFPGWTVGDLAAISGVESHRIRQWHKARLLKAKAVTRLMTADVVSGVGVILSLDIIFGNLAE